MSLLKLCQEYNDLSSSYAISLGQGRFLDRRGRGGCLVYTSDLEKAKKFGNREEALREIEFIRIWEHDINERAKELGMPHNKKYFLAALPLLEAKDIRFG